MLLLPVDCSAVFCAVPTCPNPVPADIENGICCALCPPGEQHGLYVWNVACSHVILHVLIICILMQPIPADIKKGICCPICPKGKKLDTYIGTVQLHQLGC